MDEKAKQERDALLEMFQTPGWGVVIRHLQDEVDFFRKGAPYNIVDEKALWYSKGLMAAKEQILSLQELVERAPEYDQAPPEDY